MITTVLADNTVKIPDAIARVMGLTPGAALDLQVTGNGTLLLHKRRSRGDRADKLLGIGRPFLKPGEDPVADLIQQREQDDLLEHGPDHPRP
ncbi:MAG: hypothetical protein M5U12_34040 [Verrucomicrobia bacterium]|nr:hypothetical protein [Verrucomicrobiota bacterium]